MIVDVPRPLQPLVDLLYIKDKADSWTATCTDFYGLFRFLSEPQKARSQAPWVVGVVARGRVEVGRKQWDYGARG